MKRETIICAYFNGLAPHYPVKAVTGDDMAAREALVLNQVTSFNTAAYDWDIEETPMGEKQHLVPGQHFNQSPNRYIGVEKIYTHEQVIAEMEETIKILGERADESYNSLRASLSGKLDAYKTAAEIFRQHDVPPPVYIHGALPALVRFPSEPDAKFPVHRYVGLSKGEKVYDGQAKQIWPAP